MTFITPALLPKFSDPPQCACSTPMFLFQRNICSIASLLAKPFLTYVTHLSKDVLRANLCEIGDTINIRFKAFASLACCHGI